MVVSDVDDRVREVQSFFGSDPMLDAYAESLAFRPGEKYVFQTFLHRGGNLLDAGCGTGRVSMLLSPHFRPIDAFDHRAASRRARAKHESDRVKAGVRFQVADATSLPFADATYDNVVFAYNGIEGIASNALRDRALDEMWRVLKPGGRFGVSTKSWFNWAYVQEFRVKGTARKLLARLGIGDRSWAGLGPGDILHRENGHVVRLHTTNPLTMGRQLRRKGFRVLYFNSEVRLRENRTSRSVAAYFDPWDHHFVCEKRATA